MQDAFKQLTRKGRVCAFAGPGRKGNDRATIIFPNRIESLVVWLTKHASAAKQNMCLLSVARLLRNG
jgi:hypothetical protein